MYTYDFTLIVEGTDFLDDEIVNAVFEAGCDDATVGGHAPVSHALTSPARRRAWRRRPFPPSRTSRAWTALR